MKIRRVIVIGASAGGVEALKQLVSLLPADFPAPLIVVLHVPAHGTSVLPNILTRSGQLHAVHPGDGQTLETGHIYIAPPDRHLLVKDGYLMLTRGPRENGHRPAVDTLFRTAARAYGPNVVAVVLSGALDDGMAGSLAVKARGGVVIVQTPEDALYDGMPSSVIENVAVDYILSVPDIASLLIHLAQEQPQGELNHATPEENIAFESDIAELDMRAVEDENRPGTPSVYACPECGGILWEVQEGDLMRFRCRVGHAFSPLTLLAEQTDQLEEALWVALRALEERESLTQRMTERAHQRGHHRAGERFEEQSHNAGKRAKIIRDVLLNGMLGGMAAVADTDKEADAAQRSEGE